MEIYFNQRKDVSEKVIACKVESFCQNVRLESVAKIRNMWLNFFNNQQGSYEDLTGVRTVVHDY